ncbi:MAG: hypothetical protein KDJ46_07280 [Rhodobiaceae bacterium]|nr:hypothetical protein [Rhodobiaceae bacterium]
MTGQYTASKSQTQNRPGWSMSFRHPLRPDARGKPGLKVRRGLGTDDGDEADRLVAEMNEILSDESWWNASKRQEAERRFSKVIVDAFYDDIQAGRTDTWALREQHIPLPSAEDGYSRVMFVGTTGAGKTSLLRHFIGSDPEKDRFPSTSTAKTTISDIEVIPAEGPFAAVVTFFSEHRVQANVEDCLADACLAVWEGAPDEKIIDELLNHDDQKFRLGYILGSWRKAKTRVSQDDWSFDDDSADDLDSSESLDDEIPEDERRENQAALERYLDRIKALASKVSTAISGELGENIKDLKGSDRDAAEDLFEEYVQHEPDFAEIVHDILDDVRSRFELIEAGDLQRRRSGWPEIWTYETEDRSDFIRQVRWFSSNYAPQFGRLLTPLVDGVRAKGPLFPGFDDIQPRLVLLDGQGLGHTPESSSSVTTHITRRYRDVDVILLVDSAQNPMQAAPLAVMRSVASSGHNDKLAIAFTHFDQVKGDNLPRFEDKRNHVLASVTNALSSLKDVLGAPVIRALERDLDDRCFMLGGLHIATNKLPGGVIKEMNGLLKFFERAIQPPPPPEACPVYDITGLLFAVQAAANAFQRPWNARLGLGSHEGVRREHWTRVKALNRRIAGELDDEYDTLRPIADLVARLSESISRFLDSPTRWTREPEDESEAEAAIATVRRAVFNDLHDFVAGRMIGAHLPNWREAYELRGRGSTFDRAREIRGIYEAAAPVPTAVVTQPSAEFLRDIRALVTRSIQDNGGELSMSSVA